MENLNPTIKQDLESKVELRWSNGTLETINADSIFEIIRDIKDPEHPHSLEQLNVVSKSDIFIDECSENSQGNVPLCTTGLPILRATVIFTPTVPHCSMASMIGLSIIFQLRRYTDRLWIQVYVKEDTHNNCTALNKQLNDKERVLAAFENEAVIDLLDYCVPRLT